MAISSSFSLNKVEFGANKRLFRLLPLLITVWLQVSLAFASFVLVPRGYPPCRLPPRRPMSDSSTLRTNHPGSSAPPVRRSKRIRDSVLLRRSLKAADDDDPSNVDDRKRPNHQRIQSTTPKFRVGVIADIQYVRNNVCEAG